MRRALMEATPDQDLVDPYEGESKGLGKGKQGIQHIWPAIVSSDGTILLPADEDRLVRRFETKPSGSDLQEADVMTDKALTSPNDPHLLDVLLYAAQQRLSLPDAIHSQYMAAQKHTTARGQSKWRKSWKNRPPSISKWPKEQVDMIDSLDLNAYASRVQLPLNGQLQQLGDKVRKPEAEETTGGRVDTLKEEKPKPSKKKDKQKAKLAFSEYMPNHKCDHNCDILECKSICALDAYHDHDTAEMHRCKAHRRPPDDSATDTSPAHMANVEVALAAPLKLAYCFCCDDPCDDADHTGAPRTCIDNCVRCFPCFLCVACRVQIPSEGWVCFACLEPAERY